ncbi:hypothetical protein KA344_00975 [bacterium]|jgi:hypothetical protein|nr:hypothetical protein [bacterium]
MKALKLFLFSIVSFLLLTALVIGLAYGKQLTAVFDVWQNYSKQEFVHFDSAFNYPIKRSPYIDYSLDIANEKYYVWIPPQFSPETAKEFGLIVFTDASDWIFHLPSDWQSVLLKRKYLFVASQNAGNQHNFPRRAGLAVIAALKLCEKYSLDKSRIYAGGFSGGARTASYLGFNQYDVFRGTIQDCGTDFYRKVDSKFRTSDLDTAGQYYGTAILSNAVNNEAVKARMKFAITTGPGDFRYGNIKDIYTFGFAKENFKCQLFDVPTQKHEDCSGETLEKVLDYLEAK